MDQKQITEKMMSGFNKALVIKQLKLVIGASETIRLNENMERIRDLWEKSGTTTQIRHKFILVDWFTERGPFHVLVSEYSEHVMRDLPVTMDIFLIRHHGMTSAGLPVPDYMVKELGGESEVARMIAVGGLSLVLDNFKNVHKSLMMVEVVKRLREYIETEKKGFSK